MTFRDTARIVRALLDIDVTHRRLTVDPALSLIPAVDLAVTSGADGLRDRLVTVGALALLWIEQLDREAGR